jgi:hypothetical protein
MGDCGQPRPYDLADGARRRWVLIEGGATGGGRCELRSLLGVWNTTPQRVVFRNAGVDTHVEVGRWWLTPFSPGCEVF